MAGLRWSNPYARSGLSDPLATISGNLNNIAWAMIKGAKTPEELEALRAQAEERRAHTAYYDAMQKKAMAEATGAQAEIDNAPVLRDTFVANTAGVTEPQLATIRDFQKAGAWQPQTVEYSPGFGQTVPGTAGSNGVSDAMLRGVRAADAIYAGRGKSNVDQMAKAVGNTMENFVRGDVLAGGKAPANVTDIAQTRFALDGGAAPFSAGSNGVVTNAATGAINESGQLARASIADKNASAGAHNRANPLLPATDSAGKAILGADGKPGMAPAGSVQTSKNHAAGAGGVKGAATFTTNNQKIDSAREMLANLDPAMYDDKEHGKLLAEAVKQKIDPATGQPDEADKKISASFSRRLGPATADIMSRATVAAANALKEGKSKDEVRQLAKDAGVGRVEDIGRVMSDASKIAKGKMQPPAVMKKEMDAAQAMTVQQPRPGAQAAPRPVSSAPQIPNIDEWVAAAAKRNPGATPEQLKAAYMKKYGGA